MGSTTTHYDPDLHGDHTDFLYGHVTARTADTERRTDRHGTHWELNGAALIPPAQAGVPLTHAALARFMTNGVFGPWFMALTELTPLDPAEQYGHTLGVRQREESQNPDATVPDWLFSRLERQVPLGDLSAEQQRQVTTAEAALQEAQQAHDTPALLRCFADLRTLDPHRGTRQWRARVRQQLSGTQQRLF